MMTPPALFQIRSIPQILTVRAAWVARGQEHQEDRAVRALQAQGGLRSPLGRTLSCLVPLGSEASSQGPSG